MRVPSAHSALTRIAAVAVTAMALGGCMSVSDPGRPAPSGTGRQRESGPQVDGAVRLPGDRPGRTDAKALRSASGSPSAKGGRSASPSAEVSATPGVSPPAARPGKPAPSKSPGGQTAPGRPTPPPDRPPTPPAGPPSSPVSPPPQSSAPPSPQPGPQAGPAS